MYWLIQYIPGPKSMYAIWNHRSWQFELFHFFHPSSPHPPVNDQHSTQVGPLSRPLSLSSDSWKDLCTRPYKKWKRKFKKTILTTIDELKVMATDIIHWQLLMEHTSKHSLVWDYFEKLPTGKASCKTCRKEVACTGGNTTGLGRHLDSHHKKLFKVCTLFHYHFISFHPYQLY